MSLHGKLLNQIHDKRAPTFSLSLYLLVFGLSMAVSNGKFCCIFSVFYIELFIKKKIDK